MPVQDPACNSQSALDQPICAGDHDESDPAVANLRARVLERSRGLVFTASSLPPLPAGKACQLWILTPAPAPISAGVFKPDRTGGVVAVFTPPVAIAKPAAVAVTIEPEAGVPAPTGDRDLVGT